ncbi:hypothetical protein M0R45_006344 [Rubus argutus]|uniref:Uncharacterized protein n=1 Tax=Rubus argutus TaxID=59490 RepID=A0AAW1YQN7_RUBAR
MAADLIAVSGWIIWLGARSWVQCLGLIVAAFDPGRIVSWRLGWRNRRSSALSSYGLGVLILICDGQGGWLVVVSQGWWRRCAKVVLACWWWWRSNEALSYWTWSEGISWGCNLEIQDRW